MKRKREKIFDVFANNLDMVRKHFNMTVGYETDKGPKEINEPLYICPLCLRGYLKIALSQNLPNPLTLEDVPPKSLGGKPLILTCKECNNRSGTLLDSVLKKHLQSQRFFKLSPGSKVEGKVSINKKGPVTSLIRIEENKGFFFHVDASNYMVKKHLHELQTNISGCKIDFTINVPNRKNAISALLRIGYLIAFNYLGNLILLSSNIHKVTEQIRNPDLRILPHSSVMSLKKEEGYNPGLYFLKEPKNCRCFFVAFSLNLDGSPEYFGVFIPGPGEMGWKNYVNIMNLDLKTKLTFRDISFNDMISDEKLVNGYHYLWKNL
jgi:hypothetical protein